MKIKTVATEKIELALLKKYNKNDVLLGNEIKCTYLFNLENVRGFKYGYIDFVVCSVSSYNIILTCYEIKTSLNDFKSLNGHNLVGLYNYYVIPNNLYNRLRNKIDELIGIILYDEELNELIEVRPANYNYYKSDEVDTNQIVSEIVRKNLSGTQREYEKKLIDKFRGG